MAQPGSPTDTETLIDGNGGYGGKPRKRAHILDWSAEDTASYIRSLGLGNYENAFIENNVVGEALVHLDHDDLREMGIQSVGHRITILKNVYNIKIEDEVPIEPEHYVPVSADAQNAGSLNAPATQDDIQKLVAHIRQRDERLHQAENDLRKMQQLVETLRDQLLPLAALIKQSQPLPTPLAQRPAPPEIHSSSSTPMGYSDGGHEKEEPVRPLTQSLQRKLSNRKLFSSKSKSPTHPTHPETPGYPQGASSSSYNLNTHYGAPSPTSPGVPGLPSDTYRQSTARTERADRDRDRSERSDYSDMFNGTGPQNTTPKSFRVSMDDPCEKVLPAALRRYNIVADWRQYSLYIVYGDQERCLELNEKPLILFKQLDREGKKPMFMLRRKATDTNVPVGGGGGITLPGGII